MRRLSGVVLFIALLASSCGGSSENRNSDGLIATGESKSTTDDEGESSDLEGPAAAVLQQVVVVADSMGRTGGDIEGVGGCPFGFAGDWGAEVSGAVFCVVPEGGDTRTSAQWIATLPIADMNGGLAGLLDATVPIFPTSSGDTLGGALASACLADEGLDPSSTDEPAADRCVAVWTGAKMTVLYLGAQGEDRQSVVAAVESELAGLLRSLAAWNPANSLTN